MFMHSMEPGSCAGNRSKRMHVCGEILGNILKVKHRKYPNEILGNIQVEIDICLIVFNRRKE